MDSLGQGELGLSLQKILIHISIFPTVLFSYFPFDLPCRSFLDSYVKREMLLILLI